MTFSNFCFTEFTNYGPKNFRKFNLQKTVFYAEMILVQILRLQNRLKPRYLSLPLILPSCGLASISMHGN